ncbi:MAG: energy transducer TonB [Verrucomicrobiota bacterium]
MRTETRSLGLALFLALVCCSWSALALNLPSGTLTPGFGITTSSGNFDHAVQYSPSPVLPAGVIPPHFQGRGVFILDLQTARGFVVAARVLKSTGNKQVDAALIATLQKWRVSPRMIYKLYVPVSVTAPGTFVFGTPQ